MQPFMGCIQTIDKPLEIGVCFYITKREKGG